MSASTARTAFAVAILLMLVSPAVHAAELECSDTPVEARGLGFSPSPELSTDAAKAAWLEKALAIYSDATFETAKDPQMMCVNQGLYSNCKLSAVPCGSTPAAAKEE
ncbi:MAG: hypothetical protein WBE04_05240 [Methyloceanibacter sp.]